MNQSLRQAPLHWIKAIDEALLALEQRPQFGGVVTSFPWDQIESRLQTLFGKEVNLQHEEKGWTKENPLKELQEERLVIQVQLAPLEDPLYVSLTKSDVDLLMHQLLGFSFQDKDAELREGFILFLGLEMAREAMKSGFLSSLSPQVALVSAPDFSEPLFESHLSLQIEDANVAALCLLPDRFRTAWKGHFSKTEQIFPDEVYAKVPLSVALEAGSSNLSLTDWKKVTVGDVLLLDQTHLDPKTLRGGVVLKVGSMDLLRGRLQEGGIKIYDYPLVGEAEVGMDDEDFSEDSFDDEEDLYGDDEDFEEDEFEAEGFDEEEESLDDEERPDLEGESEGSAESPHDEEEEGSKRTEGARAVRLTPEKIPLQMTIEVGRLKMTAQELLELAPGSLVELDVTPEQGVDLVISGKKIGRGELVRLGEVLGVRITQL